MPKKYEGFILATSPLYPGLTGKISVLLVSPAATGGVAVTLSTSDTHLHVPSHISVPEGKLWSAQYDFHGDSGVHPGIAIISGTTNPLDIQSAKVKVVRPFSAAGSGVAFATRIAPLQCLTGHIHLSSNLLGVTITLAVAAGSPGTVTFPGQPVGGFTLPAGVTDLDFTYCGGSLGSCYVSAVPSPAIPVGVAPYPFTVGTG